MADNIIQTRYRLQPQDLAGRRMDVTITNVTIEGLESLTPVLHFDGIEKPMALHPGDANDMARITHSAVLHEWIGQTVSIASIDTGNGPRLAIFSPEQQMLDQPLSRSPQVESRLRQWRTVLYALLLLLIVLFVFLYENAPDNLDWLQSLLPAN